MNFESIPVDINLLLVQLDAIADKKYKQFIRHNVEDVMYDLDYGSFFPQYVEHDVNSELLVTKFFHPGTLNFLKEQNFQNFMFEDYQDFTYFHWKSVCDMDGFYAQINRIYAAMYTLHQLMHQCIRWYNMPRFYFRAGPDPEDYHITEKRNNLHFRVDWCVFFIKRLYNKLQTEIYLHQIVVWDKIKTCVDEIGSKVIRWKPNHYMPTVYLAENRPLWCWDHISDIVMSYLMEQHPMNDDCRIKKIKLNKD